MGDAWVITSPEAQYNENAIYYFRKQLMLKEPMKAVINIMADARYKLCVPSQKK